MGTVVTKHKGLLSGSLIIALAFVVTLGSGGSGAGIASADTAATGAAESTQKPGITISPTQKVVIISSGLIEATTNVVITNNTGRSLTGTVRLLDFKSLNETGGLLFTQAGLPSDKYGLARWMTLPNGNTINLPDRHEVVMPVHIVNQPDLTPGAHYGAVVVTFGAPADPRTSRAGFKQELVSLLFVNKRGGERFGLQLESFSVDPGGLPDTATTRFKSTGNVYEVPHGYITVTNDKGAVVSKGTLNSESSLILPGTTRQLITSLKSLPVPNTSSRHYNVTVYFRGDEQKEFGTSSIIVTLSRAFPIVPKVLAVTGIIGGLLLLRLHRKKRHRR